MILTAMNTGGLPVSVSAFLRGEVTLQLWQIWLSVRLPRIVLTVLGHGTGHRRSIITGIIPRNPLADPVCSGSAAAQPLRWHWDCLYRAFI